MKNKNLTKRLLNYSAGAAALLGVSATAEAQYIGASVVERDKLVDPKNGMIVPENEGLNGLNESSPVNRKYDFAGIDVDNDGISDFYLMGFHNGYSWSANSRYSYQEFILSPYNSVSSGSLSERDNMALIWTEIIGNPQNNGQLNTPFKFPPILAKKFQNNELIPNLAQMTFSGPNSTLSPYPFAFIGYDSFRTYPLNGLQNGVSSNFLGGSIGNIGFNLVSNLPAEGPSPFPGTSNAGWLAIDFDLNEDNAATVEILGGAMNTQNGQPATAGYAVPLLPLASVGGLGLIGLVAYLRKRKQLKSA